MTDHKPRIIVMSDITSADWEPDDLQSFIHLLVSADMFEIEGIISTTGWSLGGLAHAGERQCPAVCRLNRIRSRCRG